MIMKLNFAGSVPIYQQIRDQIVQAVADGTFKDGDRLPTIRALAGEIGVNTMTVNKAYQLLKQEGYIIADRRSGAVVQCARGRKEAVKHKIGKELELLIAEAKIAGISGQEFLELCGKIYGR